MPMKLLDTEQNLETYLKEMRGRKISIVTAFASGTESLIDSLIKHNNEIDLIVGTINAFSSPKFIDHCRKKKFSFYVDFRYEKSMHWKLYLVDPDIVIIGSANLTPIGVSLARDTCVVIKNGNLYQSYMREISKIKASKDVIGRQDLKNFNFHMKSYRLKYQRMQAGLARTNQYKSGYEWLEGESNQSIPLFIWESMLSKEKIELAHKLIESHESGLSRSDIRDFFNYECEENDLPYEQGDVVLCANSKGSYIGFYTIDRIIYEAGLCYMYSYKRKRYTHPFKLNGLKEEIKKRVPGWYKKELTEISRQDICEMCQSS